MVKVSVIVPIYNVEKYLQVALDSLINQTLSDIEIICVNDGSTDSSVDILNEYAQKDNRIKVINKENSGYGATMNIGLKNATGKYIGILEPDDFAELNMFENLYILAERNNSDLVKSDYYSYRTQNNSSRKNGIIPPNKANKKTDITNDITLLKLVPSIWSAIYKKDFLNKNNIRFLETPGASYQDTSFFFKTMALAQNIILDDRAYVHYRTDNENSSVNSKAKVFAICDEYDEITNFLDNNPEIKITANDFKLKIQYRAYVWNLARLDKKYKDAFINKFSVTFKEFYDNHEIQKDFYKKVKREELLMLINNQKEFKKYISKKTNKIIKNKERRKLFSVHINTSRISIVAFGKQIVKLG